MTTIAEQKQINKEWTGNENDFRGFQFANLFDNYIIKTAGHDAKPVPANDPKILVLKKVENYADGLDYLGDFVIKSSAFSDIKKDILRELHAELPTPPPASLTVSMLSGFPLKPNALIDVKKAVDKDTTTDNYFDIVRPNATGMPLGPGEVETSQAYLTNNVDELLKLTKLKLEVIPPVKLANILEKYEFKPASTIDANGKVIKRFESFEDWAKTSTKPFESIILENLEKIAKYVNYNPKVLKVLNVAPVPTKPVHEGVDPRFAGKIMILPANTSSNEESYVDPNNAVKKQQKILGEYIHNAMAQNTLKQAPNVWFPYHLKGGVQRGGEATPISKIYTNITKQLATRGIKLAAKDNELITNKINSLNEYMDAMNRLQADLGTYSRIAGVFENTPNGELTLGMVQKAVEKFKVCLAKYGRHETALMDVMQQICNKM